MPIETMWFPEPYILLMRVTDALTEDELEAWITQTRPILDSLSEPLSFILDLTPGPEITANLINMPNLLNLMQHPHFGRFCVVGTTPLVSFWMEVLGRTVNLQFKVFPTVIDAQEFLLAVIRIAKGSLQ